MSNHINEILFELTDAQVEFVVGGGVAAVLHGVERVTLDIDLGLDMDPVNVEKFLQVMRNLGLQSRVPVPARDLMSREAVKYFGPRCGSIINIGSMASQLTPPNLSIYTATKRALDAIIQVLAKELGPRQIRVNSINPGATATEGARAAGVIGVGSDYEKQMLAMTPLGRIGQPSDIAPIAVFLASEDAGWLTGETLVASGGFR